MKTRIISGICMVIIAIAILSLGNLTLGISMGIISLIAVYEGSKAIGITANDRPLFAISILFSLCINSIYIINTLGICHLEFDKTIIPVTLVFVVVNLIYILNTLKVCNLNFEETLMPVSVLFIIVCLVYGVTNYGKTKFSLVAENIFFISYIVVFFSYIALIRDSNGGEVLIWLVLLTPWATDTLAYFSGVFFGKHKLIEKVSPKKTIEGSIGGTVGCVVVAFIYGIVISKLNYFPKYINLAIFAAIFSVVSQFGDLAASCIKREHGVKDYGSLIPGHGGILDRFDSVLFCAPLMYYFMMYFPMI